MEMLLRMLKKSFLDI